MRVDSQETGNILTRTADRRVCSESSGGAENTEATLNVHNWNRRSVRGVRGHGHGHDVHDGQDGHEGQAAATF